MPGVQLQQRLQAVAAASKDAGPHPIQDSVGDIRQAAREQAALNSGVAGVGMTAAEAELVAVGREPPPPPPDEFELAIQQATREKDTMRVQALTEAREKRIKAANSLGRRVMDRASKLIHSVVEGRKQLEVDAGAAGGTTGGTGFVDPVQATVGVVSRTAAEVLSLGNNLGADFLKPIQLDGALNAIAAGAAGGLGGIQGAQGAGGAGGSQVGGAAVEDPLSIIKDPLDVDGPFADETAR
jgi:hypothetical protein